MIRYNMFNTLVHAEHINANKSGTHNTIIIRFFNAYSTHMLACKYKMGRGYTLLNHVWKREKNSQISVTMDGRGSINLLMCVTSYMNVPPPHLIV